ncbi:MULTISPECIES: ATP-dependent DNA helicase [unclassified Roseateles]|uniref:ATP-dependent DNA helicase n=1 Tax=unclassified Roseateles TaxID=2626991 RepID=UPI0006FFB442|nr:MULTISPECIES: ATP-dependent DNA helicase [unclassified Roseateles]KQW44645.1 ATP-dependent DNA helicase [Pelomonas sp. Root405]KRA70004.1 ATP-dependent DNA helicase [Pelomonas sp. Root662]
MSDWHYSVSVRSLCEFTAKRGDLDRRFTPSATALEGQAGQLAVLARRSPGYETELPLEGQFGNLRVRGRADGYEADVNRLEEIKTIRGPIDLIPENRRALHWAQLHTYGALITADRGLTELELALVYVDADTQNETVLRETVPAALLQAAFEARCREFEAWAQQEAEHRAARDASLSALPFPLGEMRPGQRLLAEAVYRVAANGRCLLAQAPTGIGKTLGTLYPLLRALPLRQLDKIGYLTCKGTGRITALEALHALREAAPMKPNAEGAPQGALRVLTLVAKEQACEHPDKACHGDACPLASGFYDKLPAARDEAVQTGWLEPTVQRRIALRHGVCPYYLGQELLRWADVVVGDVHHAFDPHGQLYGLGQSQGWKLALLVDEAHNLIDRARDMYSVSLSLSRVREALADAPVSLRAPLRGLAKELATLARAQTTDYQALPAVPEALGEALQRVNAALGEYVQNHPLEVGTMLEFYFEVLGLQRLLDRLDTHSLCDLQRSTATRPIMEAPANLSLLEEDEDDGRDVLLSVRNIVPGHFLKERFEGCHSVTLFSATLGPPDYQRHLLGLPEDTAWIDVPAPFPPEHLTVQVAQRLSTRYEHRQASLDALVDLLAQQFVEHPGNYLAFFSSFDYLDKAAARLALRHPKVTQWSQSRAMGDAARRAFLDRFVEGGRGIGFAVLGGAFAEGVDLPGTRLIGAFIATLGLPPVSPLQEQVRERLDAMFGADHGYADLVPGMQKVVQAAGRVLRSVDDRGWVWLLDKRYARPEVRALLPSWWLL